MKLLKFEFSDMAASGIVTPLVVDVIDRACPNFKKYPLISVKGDTKSAFLSVSYGVLHVEDIMVYTHCPIKELGSPHLLNIYNNQPLDENLQPKFERKVLEEKGFLQFVRFLSFDKIEWVQYVLSRMHDEFM